MLGKNFGIGSDRFSDFDQREEIEAEKRALRVLLDSFHTEPERLLEATINNPATRRTIGKFIGYAIVKPYSGER